MPKAKIIERCALTAMLLGMSLPALAQPVLEQVINQAKQAKLRQAQGSSNALMPDEEVQPMQLWSISGINNKLVGEIWQGDMVQRLPLRPGSKLPNGWQIVSADSQSVTLKRGEQRRKLYPTAPGSTGWEFSQTPRVMVAPPGQLMPANGSAALAQARMAASSLPPMPGVYASPVQVAPAHVPSSPVSGPMGQSTQPPAPVAAPASAPR